MKPALHFLLLALSAGAFAQYPSIETATSTPTSTERGLVVRGSQNITHWAGVAVSRGNGTQDTGTLRVTVASDSTGSLAATQATAANLNAQVVGNVAHDATDSGNPVGIGLRAIAHGTNPTAVAAAERTVWYANRAGVAFVVGGHPNVKTEQYYWTTAQTNDAVITVSAGTKIVVTEIEVTCDKANTADVAVRVGFGTSTLTTAPTDGNAATDTLLVHGGISAGSGVVRGSGAGILGIGADDADLRITSEAPTSGSCSLVYSYYTIES